MDEDSECEPDNAADNVSIHSDEEPEVHGNSIHSDKRASIDNAIQQPNEEFEEEFDSSKRLSINSNRKSSIKNVSIPSGGFDDEVHSINKSLHSNRNVSMAASFNKSDNSEQEIVIVRKKNKLKTKIMKILNFTQSEPQIVVPSDVQNPNVRRSKRTRIKPLEFWRGQRPLYKVETNEVSCGKPVIAPTLVGVNQGSHIVKRTFVRKPKPKVKNIVETVTPPPPAKVQHKLDNIFDLTIHNSSMKKYFNENIAEDVDYVIPFSNYKWKDSDKSKGISTAIIEKIGNNAFGMIKFNSRAEKAKTKSSDYISHFTVLYGVVSLKVKSNPPIIVKSGTYFKVDRSTSYSIKNCRDDEALVSFTIIRN